MASHKFGGDWTREKLERVESYLKEYRKIFDRNEAARYFHTIYVDAFAGTGTIEAGRSESTGGLSPEDLEEAHELQQGSARRALGLKSKFDRYLFVELKKAHVYELEKLRLEYPELAFRIDIRREDANLALQEWAKNTDWTKNRAVVFLDPYGMQVEWATIAALAATKAVDLWILFPLGQAVVRLLTRKQPPTGAQAEKLTRFFGTTEWMSFYQEAQQRALFDDLPRHERVADFEQIGDFFVRRLEQHFEKVSKRTLALRNSRGNPLFLLCFASANPKGAKTAVRIADYLLKE